MQQYSLVIVKQEYFKKFDPDNKLKGNKEENRPHYYCFKDDIEGIFWMIPLSKRIDKYKELIEKDEKKYKKCDKAYIVKIDDQESAFVIQDMIPITEEHIERDYTKNSIPVMLKKESDIKIIHKKANKILSLFKQGKTLFKGQVNTWDIRNVLLEEIKTKKEVAQTKIENN